MMRPQLGIIGGMGPLSSAVFSEKIIRNTPVQRDQDHISAILYNDPGIPPRVEHILGKEPVSPAEMLIQIALFLERAGAQILAMPCVTAHYYYDQIREQIHIPLLNMIEETGKYLQECQITKAGVLCTEGTIRAGHLEKGLGNYGVEVYYPKPQYQSYRCPTTR